MKPTLPAAPSSALTHFDSQGQAHMVDVSAKPETHRVARAAGAIRMLPATLALVASGQALKGDVIGIARIAAIQGAKRTADLVPLCHPLPITRVVVDFQLDVEHNEVRCTAQVESFGRTGVEMEALTAVQVGLLTVYDMCKAVDRGMVMGNIRVLAKSGGKSGRLGSSSRVSTARHGGASNASFYSSATLTGIQVFNSAGTALGTFSISSGSDPLCGPNGVVAVPEPGSAALLAMGLLALCLRRRR